MKSVFALAAALTLIAVPVAFRSSAQSASSETEPAKTVSTNPYASASATRGLIHRLSQSGEGEENGTEWLKGFQHEFALRAFPRETIDWEMQPRALDYRNAFDYDRIRFRTGGAEGRALGPTAPTWAYVGPTNNPGATGQYNGPGPISGRVNAAAFANGNNDSPIYVGASGGGLWEGRYDGSTAWNGGKQWKFLSQTWDTQAVSTVALNPKDPTAMLVGTGDYHGMRKEGALGLYSGKFANGAWTWTNIARLTFRGKAVSKLLYDPEDPRIVLAATGRGSDEPNRYGILWRSVNGGNNWEPPATINVNSRSWNNVVCSQIDRATGKRFYYACGYNPNEGGEVWRSTDKGKTWSKLAPPLEAKITHFGLDICASATDPKTVYLMSPQEKTIWRSKDAGDNWDVIVDDANRHGFPFGDDGYNWEQGTYDYYLACSYRMDGRSKVDVVYAGLITAAFSNDGGDNWTECGYSYNAFLLIGPYFTHNDQHCMTFRPGKLNEALVGNDGGVYKFNLGNLLLFTNPYDPVLNKDLYIAEFYRAAWDKQNENSNQILGGTQDNSHSWTDGANPAVWQQSIYDGDGSGSVIGRQNAGGVDYQYAGGYTQMVGNDNIFGFSRTKTKWNPLANLDESPSIGSPSDFFPPLAGDPRDREVVYTASRWLLQFDYARAEGSRWGLTGDQVLSTAGYVTAITVDPTDSSIVYCGSLDGEVWRSTNKGATGSWTRLDTNFIGETLPYRPVTSIEVDPGNNKRVVVAFSGNSGAAKRIFRCDDVTKPFLTRAWTSIHGAGLPPDMPINCVELSRTDPTRIIYVGTDIGVFYTKDSGANWKDATKPLGLPVVRVNSLAVTTGDPFKLSAATFGRGIWRIDLPLPD